MKPVAIDSLPTPWMESLLRVCEKELQDEVLAQEVVEDVWGDFVTLHQRHLKKPDAAWAYLKIACLRRCRRIRNGQRLFEQLSSGEFPLESNPELDLIENDSALLRYQQLSNCMEQLPAEWREYVRLRFHFGLTLDRIGQHFQVSKQYAGRLVSKAVAQLRLCVGGLK